MIPWSSKFVLDKDWSAMMDIYLCTTTLLSFYYSLQLVLLQLQLHAEMPETKMLWRKVGTNSWSNFFSLVFLIPRKGRRQRGKEKYFQGRKNAKKWNACFCIGWRAEVEWPRLDGSIWCRPEHNQIIQSMQKNHLLTLLLYEGKSPSINSRITRSKQFYELRKLAL